MAICEIEIGTLEHYFSMDKEIIYVRDLRHNGYKLIKEALASDDVVVYQANVGRKTEKKRWLKHTTYGMSSPVTMNIELSNGCKILDYSIFDNKVGVTLEEMEYLLPVLEGYGNLNSGCKIIDSLLDNTLKRNASVCSPAEKKYYFMLDEAFRGGANYVFKKNVEIEDEIHIDYHQLYASCMMDHNFPDLAPFVKEGYFPHEFAIYAISGGRAKLKKSGYPILPCKKLDTFGTEMFGASGQWCPLKQLGSICTPDLELLFENYDVEDLEIALTMYYPSCFNGKKAFNSIIDKIYKERQTATGSRKRFYKLMNEYLAGYFERTSHGVSTWWKTLEPPEFKRKAGTIYNPKIGIFITAYGRQKLNALLHLLPKGKVIGYDTDAGFFEGKKEEIPQSVLKWFGEGMGFLHYDGILKNVTHKASKSYYGYDVEAQEYFIKQSGSPKSGYSYYWDKEKKEYVLKEVKKKDETRQHTL